MGLKVIRALEYTPDGTGFYAVNGNPRFTILFRVSLGRFGPLCFETKQNNIILQACCPGNS